MVDKSTFGLLILSSIVLALSFRDLIFVNNTSTNDEKDLSSQASRAIEEDQINSKALNKNEDESHASDFDINESFAGDEPHKSINGDSSLSHKRQDGEKKIPSLKMKSNIQTLKFLFW